MGKCVLLAMRALTLSSCRILTWFLPLPTLAPPCSIVRIRSGSFRFLRPAKPVRLSNSVLPLLTITQRQVNHFDV